MNKNLLVLFAFFIASLSINAQQCQNLGVAQTPANCELPTAELRASFLNVGYKDTDTYAINAETPCPPELNQTAPIGIVTDDDWGQIINLGFTFCFYGNMYDQIIVSDNGIVSFDLDEELQYHSWVIANGLTLPTPVWQPNAIFAPYIDTYTPAATNAGNALRFDLINQDQSIAENVGNRRFIIEWETPQFSCNSMIFKSRVILYETSNVIDILITEKDVCTTWQNGRAVVGIQNKSATRGVTPGDISNPTNPYRGADQQAWDPRRSGYPNNTIDQPDGELWRFVPDGEDLDYNFAWYADYGTGIWEYVSGDATITVSPLEETDYKAELTFRAECAYEEAILFETLTVTPAAGVPNVLLPQTNTLCEDVVGSGVAEFNINQTAAILAEFDQADLALYEVIYYYFEDQDNPLDGIAEVHIIPTADLDAFISPTRKIFILVQQNCSLDFDGDNVFNCEDPDPLVACDVTDPMLDCDGDNLLNIEETTGVDNPTTVAVPIGITDPLVPECDPLDCTQDCDGDGLFNCIDPDPLTACDPTDGTQDCDGDGILNADDTTPTCASDNCDQDCDNDGIPNCKDVNPSYYDNDTCSASRDFIITVNPIHDSTFTYPETNYCLDGLNPIVNQPLIKPGGTFTIAPQTAGDPNGTINGITGEIDLTATSTGTYIITYTTEPDVNPDPTGDVWPDCTTSSTFIITMNTTEADLVASLSACDEYELLPLINGVYYDAPNGPHGSGVVVNAGDMITTTTTLYVYAESGTTPNCVIDNEFTITINEVTASIFTDTEICDSFSLPAINADENFYTGTDGTGTMLDPNDPITTTQTIFVYAQTNTTPNCTDESSFTVTINYTPTAQIIDPVTECDSYILRNLNIGNSYYTGTNGSGTMMNPGDEITSTTTLYVYAESGSIPNCTDQSTFLITIINSPVAGTPTELSDCDNGDGTANIDISSLASEITDGQNVVLTYHQTFQDADDAINPLLTTPYIRTTGAIWARIENSDGCYDVIAVPLVVDDCYVTIPTGFSPSSNISENQTFNIRNIRDMFPNFQLFIYNRFGKEIYIGDANTDDWNGKLQNEGSTLPTGTYFYGLRLHDELELKYRGWVYLQQ